MVRCRLYVLVHGIVYISYRQKRVCSTKWRYKRTFVEGKYFCIFSNSLLFLSGACKVFDVTTRMNIIYVDEFHLPPPEGYLLKTTVEIMLRENLHNFEKRRNDETRRPALVNNKWNAITISIEFETPDFLAPTIELGNYRTSSVCNNSWFLLLRSHILSHWLYFVTIFRNDFFLTLYNICCADSACTFARLYEPKIL